MSAANLFTPVQLGGIQLANRVVLAPMTRGRAGVSRVANDFMRQYYEERASGGLLITEATAVSEQGHGWYGAPGLYTDEQADGWKLTVDAVHKRGGKIVAQLWHMGRASHTSFHKNKEIVAPSAIAIPNDQGYDANHNKVPYEVPRALETSEISGVVAQYKHGAEIAKKAGFDGVEIHAANGYLIDQFLQSVTNKRTDIYGGSFENRYRLLQEVVEAVGQVFPYDCIGVRLSPNSSYNGMGSEDNYELFPFVATQLSKFGLSYLHVIDGLIGPYHDKHPRVTLLQMKKAFNGGNVIGNGKYTKEHAEEAIRSGAADAVAFGFPYLANPDLVERFQNNWPLENYSAWDKLYGWTEKPEETLDGYLGFKPYENKA